ncbi:hypothetical protein HID58_020401 [Brassica napus]|uniref:Uncharacterized protein n=1 Tax=Brassica napus TaxID=3708 RepID=A0ABQ7XH50_BRANA|nr:hypothetical protein HID58_020401 [Brassica napus]
MKMFPYAFGLNNSSGNSAKRPKPKLVYLLLFTLVSSCFVFAPHLFYFPYPSALFSSWWEMKYGDVISQLSDYPLIDFTKTRENSLLQGSYVGLKIHAYRPRINVLDAAEERRFKGKAAKRRNAKKPKLALFSRTGSRAITNEDQMSSQLKHSHGWGAWSSNDSFPVHETWSVFIQIIPLGTDWAETYYGEPAKKLGLDYIGYKILPRESSLSLQQLELRNACSAIYFHCSGPWTLYTQLCARREAKGDLTPFLSSRFAFALLQFSMLNLLRRGGVLSVVAIGLLKGDFISFAPL